jgi:hypothetical protein
MGIFGVALGIASLILIKEPVRDRYSVKTAKSKKEDDIVDA